MLHADLGSANGGTVSTRRSTLECSLGRRSVYTRDCVRSVRAFVVGLGGGVASRVARFASNIQQVSEQLEARDRHLTT